MNGKPQPDGGQLVVSVDTIMHYMIRKSVRSTLAEVLLYPYYVF